jgi:hypothetical protein
VVDFAYGVVTTAVGQALVLTKGPLDLLRGGPRGEEKLLKNARDEVVTEALEIAIYDAIEALAKAVGDEPTARLAARHRADEEQMLAELRGHIPRLAEAVARGAGRRLAELRLDDERGAAETVQAQGQDHPPPADQEDAGADLRLRQADRQRRRGKLTEFTQAQLSDVVAYERANRKRATVIDRAQSLQEDEPFSGYDDLTAATSPSG